MTRELRIVGLRLNSGFNLAILLREREALCLTKKLQLGYSRLDNVRDYESFSKNATSP